MDSGKSVLWSASAPARLKRNAFDFARLTRHAEYSCLSGEFDDAVILAEAAAQFAWLNHSGQYVSTLLEDLCHRIGHATCAGIGGARPNSERKVLHVMTESFDVGGHTRAVKRWIYLDDESRHSLAITAINKDRRVNADLESAVADSGGEVYRLGSDGSKVLERCRRLREIALAFEFVVLHVHPSDVCPAIAFADQNGLPPILLQNHADHVFWLGARVVNLVVNFRSPGQRVCLERRGIDLGHQCVVPLPLEPQVRLRSREQAKEKLGLPRDSIVFLTIASHYKIACISSALDFIRRQNEFLRGNTHAYHLIVGLDPKHLPLGISTRLRAIKATPEISDYYDAADCYVDSFPFASVTSLLDAGQRQIPLIGLNYGNGLTEILRGIDESIATVAVYPESSQWLASLHDLASRPAEREDLGRRAAVAIDTEHLNPSWKKAIAEAYDLALSRSRISLPSSESIIADEVDLILTSVQSFASKKNSFSQILARQVRRLSARTKLRLVFRHPGVILVIIAWIFGRATAKLRGRTQT